MKKSGEPQNLLSNPFFAYRGTWHPRSPAYPTVLYFMRYLNNTLYATASGSILMYKHDSAYDSKRIVVWKAWFMTPVFSDHYPRRR